ncbi:hypothetical protein MJO29_012984 [Puccinia striiformis f. sp. tritici]|nr:hypothetical protein MJO29_012984 [Puccinia striiformis f. sp. tritici]
MRIFSEILKADLSATEENKKSICTNTLKLDNNFAKAFDKLSINEQSLNDLLDLNRSLVASTNAIAKQSSKDTGLDSEAAQDKYETILSDVDSTYTAIKEVQAAVVDIASTIATLNERTLQAEANALRFKQDTTTNIKNSQDSVLNRSQRIESKLDSLLAKFEANTRDSVTCTASLSNDTAHTLPHSNVQTVPAAAPHINNTCEHTNSAPVTQNNNSTQYDLSKDAPKIKDWPKLTGEGEYNHVEFIKTIDMFQEDFELKDTQITGKLCTILQYSAKKWFLLVRQESGKQSWAWWKNQIHQKWGNDAWRFRMEEAFDKSHFEPGTSKPLLWFSKQKDRLSAIFPDMSQTGLHERILKKCGGDLEHAVKCRTNRSSSTEDIINALEDIVERTKIGRSYKKFTSSDNKGDNKKLVTNKSDNKPFTRKCHKCGSPDHLANTCTKKVLMQ